MRSLWVIGATIAAFISTTMIRDETPRPMTREFLLARGRCCNNGCMNCPYSADGGQHIGSSHAADDPRVEVSAGDGGGGVVQEGGG